MSTFSFLQNPSLLKHQVITSLLFLIIIIVLTFKWLSRKSSSSETVPPSPPKFPIIGNLHQLGSSPHRTLKTIAEKYGPLMLLHLGNKPVLIVSSADAAKEALKTHDLAFASRPKMKFCGRLIFDYRDVGFAPFGEHWRQVRSICVLQLLSAKKVQSFRGIIEEEVALMLEKIRQGCSSSSVLNFDDIFSALTNDVVCKVAFGKKYSTEEGGSKFKELFDELAYLLGVFNIGDYIPWLEWINYFNGLEARVKRVAKDYDEYLGYIVEEEMKRLKSGNGDNVNQATEEQNFVQVLLDIQRTNGAGFSMDLNCIKGTISDMLVGGTDTTYTLLQWTMAELILHPNAMTKLQEEVRNTVGSKTWISDEDLAEMHYLKAVLKEALRLHPPAPLLIPHESRQNVKMMGYEIKEGTQVMINFWTIGRDPSLWDKAEEFQPERFLNSDVDFKGQNYQYIPFGSGRRSCPGYSFAMRIAELALASLMNSFNFALPHGVEPKDVDMVETSGIICHMKEPLLLLATTK